MVVLERDIEGRSQTFIFSLGYDDEGEPISDIVNIHDIRFGISLFDEDRVSLWSIDDVPIVAASLLVNRHAVQPAIERQRKTKHSGLLTK